MARYVLRFQGSGPRPAADVEQIRALPGTTVLDDSRRMLLVESCNDELERFVTSLPDWKLIPETRVSYPDPRPRAVAVEDD